MADYKKYAEDLIGDWERDQYAPQKDILENIYQTNWNRLSNDFSDLKDRLARNFENARLDYRNILNDVQNESFNRMRGANIDLALRGLSSSGVGNLATQADTQLKGSAVDKALADLLGVNNASISSYVGGLDTYGNKQTKLANQVEGDLGKLTDAEAANAQQYATLVGGLGEGAAGRAASSSSSGAKKKAEEDLEDYYRRLGIAETLMDDELDDNQKATQLAMFYDVTNANDVVSAYNVNQDYVKNYDKYDKKMRKYTEKQQDYQNQINALSELNNALTYQYNPMDILYNSRQPSINTNTIIPQTSSLTVAQPKTITQNNNNKELNRLNRNLNIVNENINRLKEKNKDLTYTDLYNLIYGGR